MTLADMQVPAQSHRRHRVQYHDGSSRIVCCTDVELVGAPHHILRHPDMPRVAFADLWATLAAGRKWHGYVKNLRKDGAFYWVYATAVPNVRQGVVAGYTSVRRKPSRARITELAAEYRRLLALEEAPA